MCWIIFFDESFVITYNVLEIFYLTLYFEGFIYFFHIIAFSRFWHFLKSLVIRQKGESQNGCFKKTKHAKFFEKRIFFTPLIRTRVSYIRTIFMVVVSISIINFSEWKLWSFYTWFHFLVEIEFFSIYI